MNKTESFNLDGSKNPRQPKRKDGSVNTEEKENSEKKKKPNKLSLWCGKSFGWKKRNGEKDKKKLSKRSKPKKSGIGRYCGFCKRKKSKEEEEEEEEKEKEVKQTRKVEEVKEKKEKKEKKKKKKDKDSTVQVNRSVRQPTMRDKEHQTFDQSDSKISVEEKKKSKAEKKKEKELKRKESDGRLEKSVSYAKDDRYKGEQRYKNNPDRGKSTRDITKSCCFLCAENSLAISAAIGPKPICSDKSVDACSMEKIEASCSPIKLPIHVRTVKSSLRVKVKDTCTSYANIPKPKKKRKKFRLFPKVKKSTCPSQKVRPKQRSVGCVTENLSKSEKPKKEKIHEPCCKDKAT